MLVILPITILFLWLESTITILPLLLIEVSVMTMLYKEIWVFALAFFAGLFLDSMTARPLGSTSLFLVCWLLLILLYERKYEIRYYPFIFTSSFIGIWIYLFFFGYANAFMQSLVGSLLALLLFRVFKLSKNKSKIKN